MPCWYYEKKNLKNTPSVQDGIDYETESRYRKEGARFIIDTGTKMDLGYNTMATGVVYFHRFYMFHSFKTFPRFVSDNFLEFFLFFYGEIDFYCGGIFVILKFENLILGHSVQLFVPSRKSRGDAEKM